MNAIWHTIWNETPALKRQTHNWSRFSRMLGGHLSHPVCSGEHNCVSRKKLKTSWQHWMQCMNYPMGTSIWMKQGSYFYLRCKIDSCFHHVRKHVCGKDPDMPLGYRFPCIANQNEKWEFTYVPLSKKRCLDWHQPYSLKILGHFPIRATKRFFSI